MIFSDGKCPHCTDTRLSLNTADLFECPACHLVCSNPDGLLAAIMPFLGNGEFRPAGENSAGVAGAAFAKALGDSVIADDNAIFQNRLELKEYLAELRSRAG